ncbi:hypothetical protein [Alloactinosynnema sp. L-07]|uniref:hypothetical protein n=1 Tax=Alloactinosynnema sp. L-07 TaxID=1653480 RepID=UPI00065EEFEF|nr:hypothetical protein [Alloactinosynnema sp. L-07]CRK57661.1 hypothetical protein [Alloactinosynnema sp. L-07]
MALIAAARVAKTRAELSPAQRTSPWVPILVITDPWLECWLKWDGRATTDNQDTVLILNTTTLPGLNKVDVADSVVLDAYLDAFTGSLALRGYLVQTSWSKQDRATQQRVWRLRRKRG